MNKLEILNNLFSRQTRGIKPGLERITEAAEKLGNPQNHLEIVHVAGTNGKGSTSTMIASIFEAAGYKTGLFTSPHILDFRERFIINGIPVSDEQWIHVWNDIQPICDSLELTFFEISTLIAFELFKREKCDRIVLETGMGGKLDSTNICSPLLSVITAISVEHTEYLGTTIEQIASEKIGIVKANHPLVINGSNLSKVLELAKNRCKILNSKYCLADSSRFVLKNRTEIGQILAYDSDEIVVPLAGDFQIQNVACAVTACEELGISRKVIQKGITHTFIPCRLQKISINNQQWLFDVAHNPQAIDTLCSSLNGKFHFLVGMMSDKDIKKMIVRIIPHALSITIFKPQISRAADPALIANIIRNCKIPINTASSASTAVRLIEQIGEQCVVTGSFYTISEVFTELGCSPWDFNPQKEI